MKVKTTLPTLLTDGAFFKHLTILSDLNMSAVQLGTKYYFRSGEKTVNDLVEHYTSNGVVNEAGVTALGGMIDGYYKDDWERIYTALTAEYNPIENYDRNELTTNANTGLDTDVYGEQLNTKGAQTNTKGSQTNTRGAEDITDTHSIAPYNSSALSTDDQNHRVTTQVSDTEGQRSDTEGQRIDTAGTHTDTHTKGTTLTISGRVHGNVGVTTNQQMIGAELELRRNNMIKRILEDIDIFLTLKIYE